MTDIVTKVWNDPYWLKALNEIDREPPPGEPPHDTYIRRLVAITVMRDIEEKFAVETERENER